MDGLKLLPLAILLPLFPASMLFGLLAQRLHAPWGRALLMLLWSQAGIGLLLWLSPEIPSWLPWWALATAFLYAVRALVLNEVTLWAEFMFVSLLALFWLLPADRLSPVGAQGLALAVTAPLLMLELLSGAMASRFGSAYLGLVGGLVQAFPRLSVLLALGVLGAIATPPFPLFFTLVELVWLLPPAMAVCLLLVWYFWGWAGVRLLQRLVLGPEVQPRYGPGGPAADLSGAMTSVLVLSILVLAGYGLGEAMRLAGGS